MAEKYAFLFPGQGAQAPGMVKDVADTFPAAKAVLNAMSEIAGVDVPKLLWESTAEDLARSDNSQLAIAAASLALMAALKDKGLTPAAAMGFSLGEFPALYAAGVLSFEATVKTVRNRGLIMQRVCEKIATENAGQEPGMTAVLGLPPDKVKQIADGISEAYAANMNSVRQTVVSGTAAALDAVEQAAKEAGAKRAVRLKVAGPFHCPLMQEAADEFGSFLEGVEFSDPSPTVALYSNVTGKRVTSGAEAKRNAVLHLTNPVLWTDEEANLFSMIEESGTDKWAVLEVGPGKVLSGLWRDASLAAKLPPVVVNTAEAVTSL